MSSHLTNPSGRVSSTYEPPVSNEHKNGQDKIHLSSFAREKDIGHPRPETLPERTEPDDHPSYPPNASRQNISTPGEDTLFQPKQSKWQIWWPRLRVTLACFAPVVLETLDYTGTLALVSLFL
jgi:hypothetical protein